MPFLPFSDWLISVSLSMTEQKRERHTLTFTQWFHSHWHFVTLTQPSFMSQKRVSFSYGSWVGLLIHLYNSFIYGDSEPIFGDDSNDRSKRRVLLVLSLLIIHVLLSDTRIASHWTDRWVFHWNIPSSPNSLSHLTIESKEREAGDE